MTFIERFLLEDIVVKKERPLFLQRVVVLIHTLLWCSSQVTLLLLCHSFNTNGLIGRVYIWCSFIHCLQLYLSLTVIRSTSNSSVSHNLLILHWSLFDGRSISANISYTIMQKNKEGTAPATDPFQTDKSYFLATTVGNTTVNSNEVYTASMCWFEVMQSFF